MENRWKNFSRKGNERGPAKVFSPKRPEGRKSEGKNGNWDIWDKESRQPFAHP